MHSEGINAGEMKHGPLALVDDKLPIVVVSTMVGGWAQAWLGGRETADAGRKDGCASNYPLPCPTVCAPQDTMHSKMAGVIQQLMARNGRLIVIANEEDDEMVDIVAGKYPIIAGEQIVLRVGWGGVG